MTRELAGTISGAVATVPMTLFMTAAHKALPSEEQYPLPPREITMRAAAKAGIEDHIDVPGRKTESTLAAHFGFGAAAGSLYSRVAGFSGLPPAAEGALYGIGVWGANYLGLMPALGLVRPATEEAAGRNALMIAAHVIWGLATVTLYQRLAPSAVTAQR